MKSKLKNHKLPGASSSFEKAWEGRTMQVFFQVYSPQWQTLILKATRVTRPFSAHFCLSYAQISHGGVWAANELSSEQHVTGSTLGHWEKNKLMCKTNWLKCHGQRSNFGQSVTRRFPHDFWSKYIKVWSEHMWDADRILFLGKMPSPNLGGPLSVVKFFRYQLCGGPLSVRFKVQDHPLSTLKLK